MRQTAKCGLWAVLVAAAGLGGCMADGNPAKIDPRPSAAVQYAVRKVSPAVVRLDVITESFEGGVAAPVGATGSGVIIDPEGHILTNFHVAGRARRIDITLANLERVRATLVGSDHWTDLAIVKLDMDEVKKRNLTFSFAPLGDSSQVELGQPVMALGTPYGLTRTLTAGVVSNTNRFFQQSAIEGYETGWFNNWIQTDAAINPGNSGGPLINLRGEVIGINTRGATSANNLGFAIPINVAKRVIHDILANPDHKVKRSYVGIQLQQLQDLEKFYALDTDKGVLIRSVDRDSPASAAKVEDGAILLAINDQPVNARFPEQLAGVRKMIADEPIGAKLKLTIQRAGKVSDVTVQTEKLESEITEEKAIGAWGLTVRDLTRAYLRKHKLPMIEGVLVTGVRNASVADSKLEDKDIITRVGGKPVKSVADLEAAVKAWEKAKKPVGVDIRRERSDMTVGIVPKD